MGIKSRGKWSQRRRRYADLLRKERAGRSATKESEPYARRFKRDSPSNCKWATAKEQAANRRRRCCA